MKIKLVMIVMFIIGMNYTSQAQVTQRKVGKTQVKQQKRIKQGIESGELTKGESCQLQKQQLNIQRIKRKVAADGVITRKEKLIIKNKQKKASRNIARKKHNNRN
jgi:hypothetical protein